MNEEKAAPPAFSPAAQAVMAERYFKRDDDGNVAEDGIGMFKRVARAVAQPSRQFGDSPSQWEDRFLERMMRLEFLPNSPTLMNAGIEGGQLAACFVLPVADDLSSIFNALALTARIHQGGGGTGFSFSKLRPAGDRVSSTGGISSGPLSFMNLFDHTTRLIREGGRRRGANMAVLRVDHPDIEEFISAKRTPGVLENFNLSVALTDEFFSALDHGEQISLRNPRNGKIVRRANPQHLLDAMAESAWKCGDPGVIFIDEINRRNPVPALGSIEATNPCGEQPLLPYESCTLGSLNLRSFMDGAGIDWSRLGEATRDAVVFLDNVIEANSYPADEIAASTRATRKIGLGVMGLADLLAALEIPYDSAEAVALGARIAAFITSAARETSAELGRKRGSFPQFDASVWPSRGFDAMRNATVTCVAPTGTLSMFAGVSGGIEPFFSLATSRRTLDNRHFVEINREVEAALRKARVPPDTALATVRATGSLAQAPGVPDSLKRCFATALEISPLAHLKMQATFQANVDAAVSKTVNLPAEASVAEVRELFLAAHALQLKGVTLYRYGSRSGQVLSIVEEKAQPDCRECAV